MSIPFGALLAFRGPPRRPRRPNRRRRGGRPSSPSEPALVRVGEPAPRVVVVVVDVDVDVDVVVVVDVGGDVDLDLNVDVGASVDLDLNVDVGASVDLLLNREGTQPDSHTADNVGMLSFQRLDVYRRAIEFGALVVEIVAELPRGNRGRAEQLERASESVIRNIAEGAGRWSTADSAKHYKIARGEAMECVASLDILLLRHQVSPARYKRGIELMAAVVAMLTKMV